MVAVSYILTKAYLKPFNRQGKPEASTEIEEDGDEEDEEDLVAITSHAPDFLNSNLQTLSAIESETTAAMTQKLGKLRDKECKEGRSMLLKVRWLEFSVMNV